MSDRTAVACVVSTGDCRPRCITSRIKAVGEENDWRMRPTTGDPGIRLSLFLNKAAPHQEQG